MIFRAFFIGVFSAMIVLAGILPLNTVAQAAVNLRSLSRQVLPSANVIKNANVGAGKGIATISGSTDSLSSRMWVKADTALTFPESVRLGDAVGDTRLTGTALSVAPNGVVTYAWLSSQRGGPIMMRQRALDGSLSDAKPTISVGSSAYLAMAANSTSTIVLAWSENNAFRYSYSTDNGTSWSSSTPISNVTSYNAPSLSIGPDGTIAIAFGDYDGNIYGGVWNGSSFAVESITSGGRSTSPFEANPSVAIGPDGVVYVAWRQVNGGYYYAARTSSGSWPASHLSGMEVIGTAAIAADEAGNLTFAWASNASGSRDLYVAYETASHVFEGPLHLGKSGVMTFDTHAAASINGETLIHIALDSFTGSASTEYVMLSAQGSGSILISATPKIEPNVTLLKGTDRLVGNQQSVSVSFPDADVTGSPTKIRWRWGSAPTDADSDSPGGWVTFTNPISVSLSDMVNTKDCKPETLYTQVRNDTITESEAKSATIIVDNDVSSSIRAVNLHIASKSPILTASPADLLTDSGASDGDPNYTRDPLFYMEINGASECVGLSKFQFGASASSLGSSIPIVNNRFANVLALPNAIGKDGPSPITVRLSDIFSNTIPYTNVITYDSIKPVLENSASVTMTIQSNPLSTILTDLEFGNVQVTDAYPGGYWGVWVTNSLTSTNPLTDTTLLWSPVKVDQAGTSPVVKNWSLATRLPVSISSLPPGTTFYVYVRFLDGAGNPTAQFVTKEITIDTIMLPKVNLPLVRR